MRTRTLPRHARTGQLALGWRKPRPGEDPTELYPVWPILGGAEDGDGGDQDGDESDRDDDGDQDDDADGDGGDTVDHKAEAEKWRALAKKHEARAKANAGSAKELAKLKREGMSDVEKRVDEAVAAARAEERTKAGERVARSAFLAAAKDRLADPKAVADDVNLRKYVDEETGDVDDDAIAELVDRLAPKSGTDKNDEDDDREAGRDTRRRRGRGFDQGARKGSGKGAGGGVAAGRDLYRELLGKGADKS
ncbi:head scaffolding protein [Streptomyces phage SF1]|uniref:Scaffolding protein n=2 Tax=Caudoviricetes TaxID=2731619 RepID=A0A0K1Y5A2_9CAUD|nr:hypothetical protein [Streptomyces sp. SPB78]YP_009199273.1 head scaffolding protein [Streptomyces phage SF1]YP_009213132.1 head scaffolding protein [Streptomyces phage SF3]AKY02174.1 hypothetical protein SF1_250 [Streptomyces phage SF1]ALF00136.1 hypothetical protein SF3_50 [Streptomyces phage SF3]EFL00587.1 conserved hypothetical protein [Streptomyces sp. SPB78]